MSRISLDDECVCLYASVDIICVYIFICSSLRFERSAGTQETILPLNRLH